MSHDLCPDTEHRLEVLENIIRRISAGGAVVVGNVISVADIAALAAYTPTAPLAAGAVAWVRSLRTYWTFEPSAATVPTDGISVITSSAGGATRWLRSAYADAVWRIGHNTWHVNPVTGNDENEGSTALTALKTLAELARRWGLGPVQQIADPLQSINLYIDAPIAVPDQLNVRPIFAGDTPGLRIFGGVERVLRVGVVTGFTAMVPGTNTRPAITDAGYAGVWESGERLRITTPGPTFNATCQIQSPALIGNTVYVSDPAYADESTFTTTPTPIAPVVGNAYAVEQLRTLPIGIISQDSNVDAITGFLPLIDMVDIELVPGVADAGIAAGDVQDLNRPVTSTDSLASTLNLYQCVVKMNAAARGVLFINSFFVKHPLSPTAAWYAETVVQIAGGGLYSADPTHTILLWGSQDLNSTIDNNFIADGVGLCVTRMGAHIGSCGFFSAGVTFNNPAGDGVRVGNCGPSDAPGSLRVSGILWGSGNAGVGLHTSTQSRVCESNVPVITGATGDFACGPVGNVWCFDNGAAGPAQGWTGPRANTWALYQTAIALGGLGRNAHRPDLSSSIAEIFGA